MNRRWKWPCASPVCTTPTATRNKQALADLAVVVPVGPGDRVSPALLAALTDLPEAAELHLVFATRAGTLQLRTLPTPESGPEQRLLMVAAGRAAQQNAGAAAAQRGWLWFLHAEAQLSPATLPALARFIGRGKNELGYFNLRFLHDGPALTWINATGAALRSHWFGLPFGDQGLVLPRSVFERLGGFDLREPDGEAHELVWRARRAGVPISAVGAPLYASARQFAEDGWWTTTLRHLLETGRQVRRFSRRRG